MRIEDSAARALGQRDAEAQPQPIGAFHHGARSGLFGHAGRLEDHLPIGFDCWTPEERSAWLAGYAEGRRARLKLADLPVDEFLSELAR
jgi:hypothetical protein